MNNDRVSCIKYRRGERLLPAMKTLAKFSSGIFFTKILGHKLDFSAVQWHGFFCSTAAEELSGTCFILTELKKKKNKQKKQVLTLNLDVSTYDDHMCFQVFINQM